MKLRAPFIAAVVGGTMAATMLAPQVASAAAHSTSPGWSCYLNGGATQVFPAPGVGQARSYGTGYGYANKPVYGGQTRVVETSTTTLTFVSVHLSPGWTDVINQAGPPKVTVQFTNTGGGGGRPANTVRLRSFFTIYLEHNTTNVYLIKEQLAICAPAG